MTYFKVLATILLALSLANFAEAQTKVRKKCETKLKVEIQKQDASEGKEDGKIILKPMSGTAPYKYIFYEYQTGFPLQEDIKKESVEDLRRGEYRCLVIDSNGCNKQVEFTIQ
jgi:hypothetical protein